jgi:hypothetical protein
MKVFLSLRRLLVESVAGRTPLFKNWFDLAKMVIERLPPSEPKYKNQKSVASYLSQVASGKRPLPAALFAGVLDCVLTRAKEQNWTPEELKRLEEALGRLGTISFKKRLLHEVVTNHLKAVADNPNPNNDMLPFLRQAEEKLGIPLSVESCKALLNDWEEYYSIDLEKVSEGET